MITNLLFYIFATILISSAICVIVVKNPVHSVLYLVLTFVTSSCLWMMLKAEFLSLALIVIYVGAVMVLFLFVVMMLDIDSENIKEGFFANLPLAITVGVIVLGEIIIALYGRPIITENINNINQNISNANQLGFELYTHYSYPVELASIILLLGLVIAVALTLQKTDKKAKYQNINKQVMVNSKDRLVLLDIKNNTAVDINDGANK